MAEFKLGRIRFIWKGDWTDETTYVKDDVVRNGGKTYLCVVGHTSNVDFYNDLTSVPTKWNQVSDGTEWKGDWAPATYYKVNDLVKYGGRVYLCNDAHLSATYESPSWLGVEYDAAKWDLYAEGFDWKGDWTNSTRYKINDLVKYGGKTYLCNLGHTSAATNTLGLEADQSKWDPYAESFDWQGDWSISTRYKVNDIVRYGGQTYVCVTGHTSAGTATLGLENDQAKWEYFHKGIEYKANWSGSSVRYKINDVVKWGADLWICTTYHTSSATFAEANWAKFVEGLQFEDLWAASTIYQPGDIVTYGGYAYVSKTNNTNQIPTSNSDDWDLFTTGFKFQGDWGTPNFYEVGNVVRYNGYTYVCTADHEATNGVNDPPNNSFWSRLNPGIRWQSTWSSAKEYRLGDAVQYGPNSYICVQEHTSSTGNRPDVDITGLYWNQLTSGAAQNVLTTQGDMVYYGGAGATRLPIGADGQVLRVNGNVPQWAYFGVIDQVYYVAPSGTDTPAPTFGVTLDKPWKTVRYATEQIENGPKNPMARNLLARNRIYIQKETKSWIDAQIAGNISPFATGLTYTAATLERDIGIILDALESDLARGENVSSRNAALTFYTSTATQLFQSTAARNVAAINYALSVALAVIQNTAPTATYQGVVTRVTDLTKTAETGVSTTLTAYKTIITDAITAGVTTGIPSEVRSNFTIFVKTGVYFETLPIIIPRETAIVGDELRSTNIRPTTGTIPVTDTAFSLATMLRIQNIISNVITNTAVTPTSGNTQTQVTTRPAGSAGAGTAAQTLVTNYRDYINFHINAAGSAPTLVGTNTATIDQNYFQAILVLEENKEFLAQEAVAFANFTYSTTCTATATSGNITCTSTANLSLNMPVVFSGTTFGGVQPSTVYYVKQIVNGTTFTVAATSGGTALTWSTASGTMTVRLSYNSASCARDVRSLVDQIKYDLIYTGNYKTLFAARYYRRSVIGVASTTEDMFYARNGSGLRNCTIQGLTGTLGTANAYGTKRPTAGAYVSLDPGWGPADTRTWVINKSCYVQNVTTFGTACTGLKIDGTLHNGGNRSIVANDFTQVLSDGIAVWCTGSNSLTELVSVFSYYGHIGYLAENGGKIRATNGNSSYGSFGCVSEGVDANETAITATVNNRAYEALVGAVLTNGTNTISRLEFSNAGQEYNTATISISGTGINVATVADEFRDNGVFEVRLTDNAGNVGGTGYITASNVAQGGNTTQITLAATDQNLSAAYVGMRILIISGTGAGQTAYINTYNNGSKIATVLKESTGTAGWDHVIPGTPIATNLDLTTQYIIEPRLTFTSPTYTTSTRSGASASAWTDMAFGDINATYTAVAASGGAGTGATFNVVRTGNYYAVTLNSGGTSGYVVGNTLTLAGTSLGGAAPANSVTITVTSINVSGVITGFTWTGQGAGGRFVAVANGVTTTQTSVDGITWAAGGAMPAASAWTSVAYGAPGGVSTWVAVQNGSTNTARSTDGGTTWAAGGSLPVSANWSSVAYGNGQFMAVQNSGQNAAYSTNGTTWTSTAALPVNAFWTSVVYGAGKWVAIASGGTNAAYSTNGTTWTTATLPATSQWTHVTYGENKFVAISNSSTNVYAYSLDGITWYSGTLPNTLARTEVRYGQGVFTTISNGSATIETSEDGITWTTRSLPATTGVITLGLGNSGRTPIWAILVSSNATIYTFPNIATTQARCKVTDGKISEIRIVEPGSGYASPPTMTITDPNNTVEASWTVRTAAGVMANPTFNNRGSQYVTATALVDGNGFSDIFQTGTYVNVSGLTAVPQAGSNIQFAGNPGYYKLVNVTQLLGSGPYTARFQISPIMSIALAPAHGTAMTMRIKYSQVRLTGHDFLSIGTGNFTTTNYPGTPQQSADATKETEEYGGGRVFYTSTDQDGNFRVGTLFSVEQATGVATLNADAFNISGLNELTLGAVALGGAGATITEFSTDPYFTANSDNIVPTQRAIKAYITSQIGGGGSQLNVNTLTAGVIFVSNNTITTTSGVQINVPTKMNFIGGVDGSPVALNFFLLG